MNCPSCGKRVKPQDKECPHCGAPQTQTVSPSESNGSEVPRRTEELEELLGHTPSAIGPGGRLIMTLIFGFMLTGLVVFFYVVSTKRRDAPPIFKIFFAILGLGGLAMVVGGIRGLVKLTTSPLLRLPSVVVGKRQKTSSSKYSDPIIYHLTIKTDDGRTKEHTVKEEVFAAVEKGDTGIAYMKGGYLLDFKAVRLPKA